MTIPGNKRRIISRSFRDDRDFWRVRELLIETYPMTSAGFNWEIRRWDGLRFYNDNPGPDRRWKNLVHLWETEDGRLVGAVHPESTGTAHLELHPDFRYLEEPMIKWARGNLAAPLRAGNKKGLEISSPEYDVFRDRLLEKFGFEKTNSREVLRRISLGEMQFPEAPIVAGYTLRTVDPGNWEDCRHIARLLNKAFNRDFHTAGEFHTFAKNAPCFHPELNLVAVAPGGSFAAFVGISYIEENRYGVFEPVCTHPGHLRKGLARSLMFEGFRRLRKAKASEVWVGTGDQLAANRLYESVGFTEIYRKRIWRKTI